jgi:hypothetical protein
LLRRYHALQGHQRTMGTDHSVYLALLNTGAWPIVRQQLQDVLEELIRRKCKAETTKLKTANSEVPVDVFVHYLTSAFFSVLI